MDMLLTLNVAFSVLFFVCYAYQFVYIIVSLLYRRRDGARLAPRHRYAVVIPARNEEAVLPLLLESIRRQSYPLELIDVFVVADSCTDRTAAVARACGAVVYERGFEAGRVGKGYALNYVLQRMLVDHASRGYDAYVFLDADNLLDPNYIMEMNRSFAAGERVLTCYRNSKNYGSNWISAGYSLWFLREARYLNLPRHQVGVSCAISGTGFLIHRDIIERMRGWQYFLLTEDIEFTIASVIAGERIGYCHKAVLYDEQPVSFRQSWRQRLRWAKGYLQVFSKYGVDLIKKVLTTGSLDCADMLMSTMPAVLFLMLCTLVNVVALLIGLATGSRYTPVLADVVIDLLVYMYLTLFAIGALTTATEWGNIHASVAKKVAYIFSFPLFILTYLPISIAALFAEVEWKPIKHSLARSLEEVTGRSA
jgi:cellulose synthase/poly-beta-1,6-N-acetylglucosamine synthase-like glycosyltransferase